MPFENILKLKKMREKVKKELEGVPRGDFDQNLMRATYWAMRTHHLGKKGDKELEKEDIAIESAKLIRKDSPHFIPRLSNKVFDYLKMCSSKSIKDDKELQNVICGKKNKEVW